MGKKQKLLPAEHRYQRLKKLVSQTNNVLDLEDNFPKIQALLDEGVECNMYSNSMPCVMWTMIKKAGMLITSDSYIAVLQILMPMYLKEELKARNSITIALCEQLGSLCHCPEKLQQIFEMFIDWEDEERFAGILSCLYQQTMVEADVPNQHSLVRFLEKILVDKGADAVTARTRCLYDVLENSLPWESSDHFTRTTGVIPDAPKDVFSTFDEDDIKINWTRDSVNKLKTLIKDGADPSWVLENPFHSQDVNVSSLYIFLMGIDSIIGDPKYDDIFFDLLELMDLLMTKTSLDSTKLDTGGRNLLHVLVSKDWTRSELSLHFDVKRGRMFETVVSKLVHHDNARCMLDMKNNMGHSPLQAFLGCIFNRKCNPELLQFTGSIISLLRTPINVDMQDNSGSTALHQLVRSISFDSGVMYELYHISHSLISSSNIDFVDNNQMTVALILAEKLFRNDLPKAVAADGVTRFFDALTSPTNINKADKNLMSSYSWVLMRKNNQDNVVTEDISDQWNFLPSLEELLLNKGADAEIAKRGLRQSCGRDIAKVLRTITQVRHIDEEVLDQVTKLREAGDPECMDFSDLTNELRNFFFMFLDVKDGQQIHLLENVLKVLLCAGNAPVIWSLMANSVPEVKDPEILASLHRILYQCLTLGATPSKDQVTKIASAIDCFRSSKSYFTVLNCVLEAFRNGNGTDVIPVRLDVLSDVYLMTEDHRSVASSVVMLAYQTLENCLLSKSVVNILLFMATENEKITLCYENVLALCNENWLKRTILHLALMHCNNTKVLESMPKIILDKHINDKDLHGCTPLHIAYLCNNVESANFIISKGADPKVTDHFGVTPKSLGFRVSVTESSKQLQTVASKFEEAGEDKQAEHVDVVYQKYCRSIMAADSNVFELMQPMLVLPVVDRQLQCDDVKRLFERLIQQMPDLLQGEIVVAGSCRERLKAGRLDEVDVQIRLHILSSCLRKIDGNFWVGRDEKLYEESFGEWLHACLVDNLAHIKWSGIPLRLISVNHPWQFIYERPGPTQYVQMSVDVVPIIGVGDDVTVRYPLYAKLERILQRQGLLVQTAKSHQQMWFLRWGNFSRAHVFLPTYCEYEWDILDSLSTGLRLGVLVVKALLEISYIARGGPLANAPKPITSYMLKSVLFWLLTDEEALKYPLDVIKGYHKVGEGVPSGVNAVSEERQQHEKNGEQDGQLDVLDVCDEEHNSTNTSGNEDVNQIESTDTPSTYPKWMTLEDVKRHAEEGRTWAVKILQTILDLTEKVGESRDEGQLLPFFEVRYDTLLLNYYNKDSIAGLCATLLGRLTPDVFYSTK